MSEQDATSRLVLAHPANAGLIRHLASRQGRSEMPSVTSPGRVQNPYYTLGAHPDLVARLWDELCSALPIDCRAVLHGAPVLIHPATGIVFGFAGGTHTYALRLPEPERSLALRLGAARTRTYPGAPPLHWSGFGDEWVFCGWFAGEEDWCLSAFRAASGEPGVKPGLAP